MSFRSQHAEHKQDCFIIIQPMILEWRINNILNRCFQWTSKNIWGVGVFSLLGIRRLYSNYFWNILAGLLCSAVWTKRNYLSPVCLIHSILYFEFIYIVCGFVASINRTKSQFSFAQNLSVPILSRTISKKNPLFFFFLTEDWNAAELKLSPTFSELVFGLGWVWRARVTFLTKPSGNKKTWKTASYWPAPWCLHEDVLGPIFGNGWASKQDDQGPHLSREATATTVWVPLPQLPENQVEDHVWWKTCRISNSWLIFLSLGCVGAV